MTDTPEKPRRLFTARRRVSLCPLAALVAVGPPAHAPGWSVIEAGCSAFRRFTASAEAITTMVGALSAINCSAVNCAAPAITTIEKLMTCTKGSPASVATTPNNMPNGPTTSTNGNPSRKPRQKMDLSQYDAIKASLKCTLVGVASWPRLRKRCERKIAANFLMVAIQKNHH